LSDRALWVQTDKTLYRDASGNIAGIIGFTLDITERKRAEEEIKRQAGLINSLLDSIPDIIFFKDINGVYLGCNPPFAEFVGWSRAEIIGKTDYDLFDKEVADFFREHDRLMLELRQPRHNEEWITYPDGPKKTNRYPQDALVGGRTERLSACSASAATSPNASGHRMK